ncbi:MAG: InlB B-repeat-containing protein [Clostridia bacterium]|nr:InlB B-repeat-containing protein [Clostridia bacterium]
MKRYLKKLTAFLLSALMIFGAVSAVRIEANAAVKYKQKEIIKFGSYPQSEVTDTALLSKLNDLELDWVSYGYYTGNGSLGGMVQSDYMKYADVTYGGSKYRAVTFTQYRPTYVKYAADETGEHSRQDDNGYNINNVYWFKYEPLEWKIIDPVNGLVMCQSIIDSQPISATVYSGYYNNIAEGFSKRYICDYKSSSLRAWLNGDFYNLAFTDAERAEIQLTHLDSTASNVYYGHASDDYIYFLTTDDVVNSDLTFSDNRYFSSSTRQASGTDYAKSQGLYVTNAPGEDDDGMSRWWLRNPYGRMNDSVHIVTADGYSPTGTDAANTDVGVRPVMRLGMVIDANKKYKVEYKIEGYVPEYYTKELEPETVQVGADVKPVDFGSPSGDYTFDGWYYNGEKVTTLEMPAHDIQLTGRWVTDEPALGIETRFYKYDETAQDWVETNRVEPGEEVKLRLFVDTTYAAGYGDVLVFYDSTFFEDDYVTDDWHELTVNTDPESSAAVNEVWGDFQKLDRSDDLIFEQLRKDELYKENYYDYNAFKIFFELGTGECAKLSGDQWLAEFDLRVSPDVIGYAQAPVPSSTVKYSYDDSGYTDVTIGVEGESVYDSVTLYKSDVWNSSVRNGYVTTSTTVTWYGNGGIFEGVYDEHGYEAYEVTKVLPSGGYLYPDYDLGTWVYREGYNLMGWYDEYGYDYDREPFDPIPLDRAEIFLGAEWEPMTVTVEFLDSYYGELIYSQDFLYDEEIVFPDMPELEGFTFGGWLDDNGYPVEEYERVNLRNTRYHAAYYYNEHDVVYMSDGVELERYTVLYGDKVPEPSYPPTKKGHTFAGWKSVTYIEGVDGIPETMPDSELIFEAVWEANRHTVTFVDINNYDSLCAVSYEYGELVEMPDPDYTVKTGYTFDGWYFEDGTPVAFPFEMPDNDVIICADWVENVYEITFDSLGGSPVEPIKADYLSEVDAPAEPEKEGFRFVGWSYVHPDSGHETEMVQFPFWVPADCITLYAVWEANEHTVTFDTQGGREIEPVSANYGELVEMPDYPVKTGYAFAGWSYEDGTPVEFPFEMPDSDVVIRAEWIVYQFEINFESQGGSFVEPIKADYLAEVDAPAQPEKEGFRFVGWSYLPDDYYQSAMAEFPIVMPVNGTTLYAVWEPEKYTVTYNIGEESLVYSVEFDSEIPQPDMSDFDGKELICWLDSDGNEVQIPFLMPAHELEFTARFRYVSVSDEFNVTATYDDDCFAEDAKLSVNAISGESKLGSIYMLGGSYYKQVGFFNIKMLNGKSEAVQPQNGKKVTVSFPIPAGCSEKNEFIITHWLSGGGRERFTTGSNARIESGFIFIEIGEFSEFSIHVRSSAKVTKAPSKTAYNYKEELDLSGIELTVTMTDGTTRKITDTSKINVSGYDSSKIGEQTVTVDYNGEKAAFTVTVSYAWWQWIIRILFLGFLWY